MAEALGTESRALTCPACGSSDVVPSVGFGCPGFVRIELATCRSCGVMDLPEAFTVADRKHHRDYLDQPEARRWTSGSLPALMVTLRKEAFAEPGKAQWRILSHGALISLRLLDGKLALRIARKTAATTPEGGDKWQVELNVFL